MRRLLAAAMLAMGVVGAAMAQDGQALSLDAALKEVGARRPEAVLAEIAGLPYRHLTVSANLELAPAQRARIETMARFFEVLLVDLEAAALNERMANAYGAWTRLQSQAPDTASALQAKVSYLDLLSRRNAARNAQRLSRAVLALALGRPDRLPDELLPPEPAAEVQAPLLAEVPVFVSRPGSSVAERRRQIATLAAEADVEWLRRSETPRARGRMALAERTVDDARERAAAGQSADLGMAMAAVVEAQFDEQSVQYALTLALARREAITSSSER